MESSMTETVRKVLEEGIAVMQVVERDTAIHEMLLEAAKITSAAMKMGSKLMVAGNGGSVTGEQHLVAEFVSRLVDNRPAMRAVALTTDTSILTAVGNDYTHDRSFAC